MSAAPEHYRLLYPTEFLAWPEFKGKDVTLTIKSVSVDELPIAGSSKKEKRPVVRFVETEKKWIMNKTCAKAIAVLYGPNCNAWVTKKVTLYPDPDVRFGKDVVGGIRVRAKVPA